MAFKVNYGLERAERNRAKQAKKEAKLKARRQGTALDDQAREPAAEDGGDPAPEAESEL